MTTALPLPAYDYIILGAGSAGCVLANRLSADPSVRVLIVEAGRMDDDDKFRVPGFVTLSHHTPDDWNYHTAPIEKMDAREMYWGRGKVVGGCSSTNGTLYVRGHRDNYDEWRDGGCPGWGWDDVLPLFKRSEGHEGGETEFHGGDGPLKVEPQKEVVEPSRAFVKAVANRFGVPADVDFNGAGQEGAGIYHTTIHQRRRSSASTAFLHPVLSRPNLQLLVKAHVTRIGFEGTRARTVHLVVDGRAMVITAEREILVSAGAIGSPQLLLLSGVGPADDLRALGIPLVADIPGVGRNLHDHLMSPLRFHATDSVEHRGNALHFLMGIWHDKVNRKGFLGSSFLEGGAFLKSSPDQPRPDIQFLGIPWPYPEPNDDDMKEYMLHAVRKYWSPTKADIATTFSFTLLPGLIYPKSRGRLTLKTANPFDHPHLDSGYLTHPDDLRLLIQGMRMGREIAATEPLASHLRGEAFPGTQYQTDDELAHCVRFHGKTIYHPVGTCKMGVDALSVVDPHLRVHGLQGIRVIDASIMPKIIGGNTNAPTIMIGEKGSDLVLGRTGNP